MPADRPAPQPDRIAETRTSYDTMAANYADLRWTGWHAETRALPLSHGIAVYPFLWPREAHEDLAATTRNPAPIAELFSLQDEFAARFAEEPDATALHIRVD